MRCANRLLSAVTGLLLAGGAPLAAQATGDQPTLTLGMVAGGIMGSQLLWRVPNQTVLGPGLQNDQFDISRHLTGNIAFGVQAALYRSSTLGIGGEITYFGIGTRDACALSQASGSDFNRVACEGLNRDNRSTTATSFMGSAIIRPWSRKTLQPYLRVGGGFSAITDNLVAMTAYFGSNQGVVAPIYPSEGGLSIRPTVVGGLGLGINAGTGYLIRLEARQTWMTLKYVTGPSEYDGLEPPMGSTFKAFPSLLIGFDIVLEKSRGRRY